MQMAEYGIHYAPKHEKALVTELNHILADVFSGYAPAKLSKTTSAIMLEARLPFVHTYFYMALLKKYDVYLELYPNTDREGKKKFPGSDATWVLLINSDGRYTNDTSAEYQTDCPSTGQMIQTLLEHLAEHWELLRAYQPGEERS